MIERILSAAIKYGDLVMSVERPGRHHNVFWELDRLGVPMIREPSEQGFVTNTGRFVDRKEGCRIAWAADQIKIKHGPEYELFSEDMW